MLIVYLLVTVIVGIFSILYFYKFNRIERNLNAQETVQVNDSRATVHPLKKSEIEESKEEDNSSIPNLKKAEIQEQATSIGSASMADDDLDDILDEAAEEFDLDACLDEAVDSFAVEEPSLKDEKKQEPSIRVSRTIPKVWQEALNVLPLDEKLKWVASIQSDISKQSSIDYQRKSFSSAYASEHLKLQGFKANIGHTAYGMLTEILEQSVQTKCAEKLLQEGKNSELFSAFAVQLKKDLRARLLAFPQDVENIKADLERFPKCAKLIS